MTTPAVPRVILGLDVGTTGTKAVAFAVGSTWRQVAVREYPLLQPAPGQQVQDPDLVMAAADTAVDAGVRVGYSVLETTQNEWQAALVRWRCGLSAAQRREFGAPPNWNCRDLKFFIGHLTFDQLDAERAQRLNAIPTRFKLPAADVDLLIDAGADSLRSNDVFKAFLASLR